MREPTPEEMKIIMEGGECDYPGCNHLLAVHWMETIEEIFYCMVEGCLCEERETFNNYNVPSHRWEGTLDLTDFPLNGGFD